MLPIEGLRGPLIILFDVLMRRRGTVFKEDVFNFLIYNTPVFSLEFLYTVHLLQNHFQNIHILCSYFTNLTSVFAE
jgi:hypothetical protein